jgi:hypothetical protein
MKQQGHTRNQNKKGNFDAPQKETLPLKANN